MALTQINSNSIADGSITNADISSSAAIDESKLTITSVGGANGVDFNDNVKARFGTGNDLEIYHDGSNSYVQDSGTGELRLRGTTVRITDNNGSENFADFNDNGSVDLFYDNSKKFETTSSGIQVTGSVTCNAASPQVVLQDNDNTGVGAVGSIVSQDSSGSSKWLVGDFSTANENLYLYNYATADLILSVNNGGKQINFTSAGHFVPADNNAQDLGTSSTRWRNVYTNDLNLSNEGSSNDVDGTWGSWTIQEGEDDLFLLNRRNGKKYKFALTEVN